MIPLVELRGVARHYGGVRAVDGVDLELRTGEVLGLLGHNGAGKSTLIRMLAGVEACDEGEILVDGRPVRMRSPRDARALGIETLYQDLALADNLDAVANLFLGRELRTRLGLLDESAMARAARETLARVQPAFDAFHRPVSDLSGGQRQAIAIARALHFEARALVLDEPTAALGPAEKAAVGELLGRLAGDGLALLVISHDLHDVFARCDRIAVMRAGRLVGSGRSTELSREQVLEWIVGQA